MVYVVDRIVRHAGSGPVLSKWCNGTDTVKQTITSNRPTTYPTALAIGTVGNSMNGGRGRV